MSLCYNLVLVKIDSPSFHQNIAFFVLLKFTCYFSTGCVRAGVRIVKGFDASGDPY